MINKRLEDITCPNNNCTERGKKEVCYFDIFKIYKNCEIFRDDFIGTINPDYTSVEEYLKSLVK